MMKKTNLKPVVASIGAALTGTMLLAGSVNAADNPFGLSELNSGYMQVAAAHEGKMAGKMMKKAEGAMEGKCGEGKCGGMKTDAAAPAPAAMEGKCGGDMKKKAEGAMEGKCGGMKTDAAAPAPAAMEGKCGEGKCGGKK